MDLRHHLDYVGSVFHAVVQISPHFFTAICNNSSRNSFLFTASTPHSCHFFHPKRKARYAKKTTVVELPLCPDKSRRLFYHPVHLTCFRCLTKAEFNCSLVSADNLLALQEPPPPRRGPSREAVGSFLHQDLSSRGSAPYEHQHHGQREEGSHWGKQRLGRPLCAGGLCRAEGEQPACSTRVTLGGNRSGTSQLYRRGHHLSWHVDA